MDVSPETAFSIATASLERHFPLASHLSSWMLYALSEISQFSLNNLQDLVMFVSSGSRETYKLLKCLTEMTSHHNELFEILSDQLLAMKFLSGIVDADDGFVTLAGCEFLEIVFYMRSTALTENTALIVLERILQLLAGRRLSVLKEKGLVFLLKFTLEMADSISVGCFEKYEDKLLMSFARQINSEHASLAISYFLVLANLTRRGVDWSKKIIDTIVNSCFPLLLCQELIVGHKFAIENALKALQLLASGLQKFEFSPLLAGVVSGFLLFREQREQKQYETEQQENRLRLESEHALQELEVNRDLVEQEVIKLQNTVDYQIGEVRTRDIKIRSLEATIESFGFRVTEMEKEKQKSDERLSNIMRELETKGRRESVLRSQTNRLEQELQRIKHENAKMLTELSELYRCQKTQNAESQVEIARLRQKCAHLRESQQKVRSSSKVDAHPPAELPTRTPNSSPPECLRPENPGFKRSRRPTPISQRAPRTSRLGDRPATRELIR
jgi:hypothetical protein